MFIFFSSAAATLEPGGLSGAVLSPQAPSAEPRTRPEHSRRTICCARGAGRPRIRRSRPVAAHCRTRSQHCRRRTRNSIRSSWRKRDRESSADPLVSMLIPAYNAAFFAACFDSALAQTYDNIEIVVCDDSTGRRNREYRPRARTDAGGSLRPQRSTPRRPRATSRRCFERARGRIHQVPVRRRSACADLRRIAPRRFPARSGHRTLATSHRRRIDANGNALGDQPATVPIVDDERGDRRLFAGQRNAHGRAQRRRRTEHDALPQGGPARSGARLFLLQWRARVSESSTW